VLAGVLGWLPVLAQGGGFVRKPGESTDTSCVADNDTICIGWAIDNIDRYVTPTLQHVALVLPSVALGFAIAFGLALLSHRRHWLVPAFTGITGIIYTLPSIALFLLLLPITGRGYLTAVIALTAYNLQIIYRNIVLGFANVPNASKDAGRGMGMTERQLLWRVELPLALPEIVAGLRIATVSTIAIATLAVFAGAGGLGAEIYNDITFKTGIVVCTVILLGMALLFDFVLVLVQARLTRWRDADRGGGGGRHWISGYFRRDRIDTAGAGAGG
jgi:osmoprotectant transport system permease protein